MSASSAILIQSDTTWNNFTASRPWIQLSQPVVVFSGVTLTIDGNSTTSNEEPVAEEALLIFHPFVSIRLQANAQVFLNHVIMTSSSEDQSDGNGIEFVSANPGRIELNHVTCQSMRRCLVRYCCSEGQNIVIQNSIFADNTVVFEGYSGDFSPMQVYDSLFVRNQHVAANADYIFEGCIFSQNNDTLVGERMRISSSLFLNNVRAVQDPNTPFSSSDDYFLQDVILYRNQVGVFENCCGNAMSAMTNVSFLQNQVALRLSRPFSFVNVSNLNFVYNRPYHVFYSGVDTVTSLTDMYWGIDEPTIDDIAPYIFDVFDNFFLGLVELEPIRAVFVPHDTLLAGLDAIAADPPSQTANISAGWRPPTEFLGVPIVNEPYFTGKNDDIVPSSWPVASPTFFITNTPTTVAFPSSSHMTPYPSSSSPSPSLYYNSEGGNNTNAHHDDHHDSDPSNGGHNSPIDHSGGEGGGGGNPSAAPVADLQQCIASLEAVGFNVLSATDAATTTSTNDATSALAVALYVSLTFNFLLLVGLVALLFVLVLRGGRKNADKSSSSSPVTPSLAPPPLSSLSQEKSEQRQLTPVDNKTDDLSPVVLDPITNKEEDEEQPGSVAVEETKEEEQEIEVKLEEESMSVGVAAPAPTLDDIEAAEKHDDDPSDD